MNRKDRTRSSTSLFGTKETEGTTKTLRAASRLATRAGGTLGRGFEHEAGFEQLEPRQLLFGITLLPSDADYILPGQTITAFNPATGVGTVDTQFGYAIPFLERQIQGFQQAPDPILTNFDTEGSTGTLPAEVDNPTTGTKIWTFATGLQIQASNLPGHAAGLTDASISLTPPVNTAITDYQLRITMPALTSITFRLVTPGTPTPVLGLFLRNFQFNITNGTSITPGTTISMTNRSINSPLTTLMGTLVNPGGAGFTGGSTTGPDVFVQTFPSVAAIANGNNNFPVSKGQTGSFDEIVLARSNVPSTTNTFNIDNFQVTPAGTGRFADFVAGRLFGADFRTVVNLLTSGTESFTGAQSQYNLGPVASGTVFPNSGLQIVTNGVAASLVASASGKVLDFTVQNANSIQFRYPDSFNFTPTTRQTTVTRFNTVNGLDFAQGTQIVLFRGNTAVATLDPLNDTSGIIVRRATAGGAQYTIRYGDGFDSMQIIRDPALSPAVPNQIQMTNIVSFFASVVVNDLYNRPMRATIQVIAGQGDTNPRIDADDDGIPNFNDGIGRIDFFSSTAASNFTAVGGTITYNQTDNPQFQFHLSSLTGLLGDFTSAGFGFTYQTDGTTVSGLPTGTGSVVIGSPYIRDNSSPVAYHGVDPTDQTLIDTVRSSLPVNRINSSGAFDPTAGFRFIGTNPGIISTSQPVARTIIASRVNFISVPLENRLPLAPSPVLYQGLYTTTIPVRSSIGNVVIHGVLFGNTLIQGAAAGLHLGVLYGSLTVQGDVGNLTVATDSGGYLQTNAGLISPDPMVATGSVITIGRNAGAISIGGRNLSQVLVLGDTTASATLRPALSFIAHNEQEVIYSLGTNFQPPPNLTNDQVILTNVLAGTDGSTVFGSPSGLSAYAFGGASYYNGTIAGAEYVGGPTGGVTITGLLAASTPVEAVDTVDVYAFAASPTTPITIAVQFPDLSVVGLIYKSSYVPYARVVDAQGRVLATYQYPFLTNGQTPQGVNSAQFTFTPDSTNVYYLELTVGGFNRAAGIAYTASISGMPSTTLGAFTVGANSPSLLKVNGSVGMVSGGQGSVNTGGADASPSTYIITYESVDRDLLTMRQQSIQISGSLTAWILGSNIANNVTSLTTAGPPITIGGNLGALVTGVSSLAGGGPGVTNVGDITALSLSIGGGIGTFEIAGAVGFLQQNAFPNTGGTNFALPVNNYGPFILTTGAAGGKGDIGLFSAAAGINGTATTINTGPGSTIDRFISLGPVIHGAPKLNLGVGSNIRFATFTNVTQGSITGVPDPNFTITIGYNSALTLTDDSGTTYQILISGGTVRNNASTATLTTLGVRGQQGVIVGSFNAVLDQGATLTITTLNYGGSVDFGQINVTTTNSTTRALSSVGFGGSSTIAVLGLNQASGAGGLGLGNIINSTNHGDLVAVDVAGVNVVSVWGNLGSTRTVGIGPKNIGPFLGITNTLDQTPGTPIFLPPNLMNNWGGQTYIPLSAPAATTGATLEDIGSPIDPYLNGLIVRAGPVTSVAAMGSVGDVILQDPTASINLVIANNQGIRVPGEFHGITGSILAANIGSVDIGEGLVGPGSSPFAQAGIFAAGNIQKVYSSAYNYTPFISGLIIAGSQIAPGKNQIAGVANVSLDRGSITNAYIAGSTFDSWWQSSRFTNLASGNTLGDAPTALGQVNSVIATNATFSRNTVFGNRINRVQVYNLAMDASTIQSTGVIGNIIANSFTNSTLGGEPLEYLPMQVLSSGVINLIQAQNGNATDLIVNSLSGITTINATNFIRLDLTASNVINNINASQSILSSTINAGRIDSVYAGTDIRATSINSSGPLGTVKANSGTIANTSIRSNGSNGKIDTVWAASSMTAVSIFAESTINTISAGANFSGSITTSRNSGNVNSIFAGGNFQGTISIKGAVNSITVNGNLGQIPTATVRDSVDINANLGSLTVGRQLYADVRVNQAITGGVSLGTKAALTSSTLVSDAIISAFGRISGVNINGDFAGRIVSFSGGIGTVNLNKGSFRFAPRFYNATTDTVQAVIDVSAGNLDGLNITGGSLFRDVIARDGSINSVKISGASVSMGVDPGFLVNAVLTNARPVTANRDGATVVAALDIQTFSASGSIAESIVQAGRNLNSVTISKVLSPNPAAAAKKSYLIGGDQIGNVAFGSTVTGLGVLAGVTALGTDALPGGTGAAADTVKSGSINSVTFGNSASTVFITAGLTADGAGNYNTVGSLAADGLSTITKVTVAGTATNMSVFAKTAVGTVTTHAGTITKGGAYNTAVPITTPVASSVVYVGIPPGPTTAPSTSGSIIFTIDGSTVRVTYSTASGGAVGYDPVARAIVFFSTTIDKPVQFGSVTIDGAGALPATLLGNVSILSTANVSVTSLNVKLPSIGSGNIYIDGNVDTMTVANIQTTGKVGTGGKLGTLLVGNPKDLTLQNTLFVVGANIGTLTVYGDFGITQGDSRVDALTLGSFSVKGTYRAVMSVAHDVTSINISTGIDSGFLRSGGLIGSLTSGYTYNALVSARGGINSVTINGTSTDSEFLAGADLGTDGTYGGTGAAADYLTSANIGSFKVSGAFNGSSIAAGVLRLPAGFYTTSDNRIAPGRSTIGSVSIASTSVGSSNFGEQYGVISNGSVGNVQIAGVIINRSGNFFVVQQVSRATPLEVTSLTIGELAPMFYGARIVFNQQIDSSTLSAALSITNIRDPGPQATNALLTEGTNLLDAGTDYTVSYDPLTNTALIQFSQTVTSRPLVDLGGGNFGLDPVLPGPGIYRFVLDATVLKAATVGAALDGAAVGQMGTNFSQDAVVGDAGDRFIAGQANIGGTPVDFYPAISLNDLMSPNSSPKTGLPGTNFTYTVTGTIGDQPDSNLTSFLDGSDFDVYRITLYAGQILQFGAITGAAVDAGRTIMDSDGNTVASNFLNDNGTALQRLQNPTQTQFGDESFLVHQTGTYYIVMAQFDSGLGDLSDPTTGQSIPTSTGTTGTYAFTMQVFDDGDSGFFGSANSNVGDSYQAPSPVGGPPLPTDFATVNSIVTRPSSDGGPDFSYVVYSPTSDAFPIPNLTNTNNPQTVIYGTNGLGIVSMRTPGLDGNFNTADDVVRLDTDSGNGIGVMPAYLKPSDFTANPTGTITLAGYSFKLVAPSGSSIKTSNTNNDNSVVAVNNPLPGQAIITSTRKAGADKTFGTADDTFTTTIQAAIGTPGNTGFPQATQPDVDIYQLNNYSITPPGTMIRATLKTSNNGGNLGLLQPIQDVNGNIVSFRIADNRGLVQFGIFDTSFTTSLNGQAGTSDNTVDGISNAVVVAAPGNVAAYAGHTPNQTTSNTYSSYGYDANGDFYIQFLAPTRFNDVTKPASLALYVQGVVRTDYQVELSYASTVKVLPTNRKQNFLIATSGGSVNWLETGGKTTNLLPFSTSQNGIEGLVSGISSKDYILTGTVANPGLIPQLQAMYDATLGAGVVKFSTNPGDFKGQAYSTIYLTASQEPAAFFNNGTYGVSQGVDVFNTNASDQAIIFLPSLNFIPSPVTGAVVTNPSSQAGVDNFVQQLLAATTRRTTELLGTRITQTTFYNNTPQIDPTGDLSPLFTPSEILSDFGLPGYAYTFFNTNVQLGRPLAVNLAQTTAFGVSVPVLQNIVGGAITGISSTQFILGGQVTTSLLNRIFGTANPG